MDARAPGFRRPVRPVRGDARRLRRARHAGVARAHGGYAWLGSLGGSRSCGVRRAPPGGGALAPGAGALLSVGGHAVPSGALFDVVDPTGAAVARLALIGDRLDVRLEDRMVSPAYGAREPAMVVVAEQEAADRRRSRPSRCPRASRWSRRRRSHCSRNGRSGRYLRVRARAASPRRPRRFRGRNGRRAVERPIRGWCTGVGARRGGTYLSVAGSDILSRPAVAVAREWRTAERRAEGWRTDRGALGAAGQVTGDRKS